MVYSGAEYLNAESGCFSNWVGGGANNVGWLAEQIIILRMKKINLGEHYYFRIWTK
jgi:hypothetical protein